jgi:DNA-binding CsgD family transcriptional regulator
MQRLPQAKQSVLLAGLRELYAQTDIVALRSTLVALVGRLIDGDIGSDNEMNAAAGRPTVSIRCPDPCECQQYHAALDVHAAPRGGAQLRLSNQYNVPVQVRDQLVLYFERPGSRLPKTIHGHNFAARDQQLLHILRTHYWRAVDNVQCLTALRAAAQTMADRQADEGQALVIVDRAGEIGWMSSSAATWLTEAGRDAVEVGAPAPPVITAWLRKQSTRSQEQQLATPVPPLRIRRAGGEVVVRIAALDGDGSASLLLKHCPQPFRPSPALTPRETEVLHWIGEGKSNPEIATILGLSVRTVYKHLENIFPKLGVENRIAAMHRACEMEGGLVKTDARREN